MILARAGHGSCFIGSTLFVIFGSDDFDGRFQCSFEKLETNNMSARWQLIELPTEGLKRRINPVVAALNTRQILIMGGSRHYERG